MACTSPRCGFLGLHKELDKRLTAWNLEEGEDLDDSEYQYRYMSVSSLSLKHVIGRPGRTLRKLKSFVGVSASIVDTNTSPKICSVGFPRACLPAEFIVEMIVSGHYSIMESLDGNDFRWTISLVFLHFPILYSVLFFSRTFVIGIWYIVCLLVIFLFAMFLSISWHFPFLRFYLFVGAQDF